MALQFAPLVAPPGADEVDFGADAGALNLPALTDSEFADLERAVLTHHVVVVRNQGALTPREQFELTRRFDPSVTSYGHGNRTDILEKSVLVQDLVSIPDWPQVKLLGNGVVRNHEGIPEARLRHPSHNGFHKWPLTPEQEQGGFTRFYRWHIDAALYALNPPKVTTLLALQVPQGPPQTVVYDDDSGDVLEVPLGTTAFVSGEKAFSALSSEAQDFALRTRARYAPHPYVWIKNARALSNGLGMVTEGRELPLAELPDFEEDKRMTLPLVWKNPVTGKLALQVHACCVEDLVVDGKPLGDLAESRRLLYQLMRPAIGPRRVYAHPWVDGDLVIFNNRAVWHTVVGCLAPTDVRIYHQCNLASSEPPLAA